MILIDDSGVRHVAQAICDPHKENRMCCGLQGARHGRQPEGKRDPRGNVRVVAQIQST